MTTKLFCMDSYEITNGRREKRSVICDTSQVATLLLEDKGYHYPYMDPNKTYIQFGDIDGATTDIDIIKTHFIDFYKNKFNITLKDDDFATTYNTGKEHSWHIFIPKVNCRGANLLTIMEEFKSLHSEDGIDTSVYKNHLWRNVNQCVKYGERPKPTPHIMLSGEIKDTVIDLIPENSINIDTQIEVEKSMKWINEPDELEHEDKKDEHEQTKNQSLELSILKECFDKCYSQSRFEDRDYWMRIGFGLFNHFGQEGYELFKYASSKSKLRKHRTEEAKEENEKFWKSLKKRADGITIKTLFSYAREDNEWEFAEIMLKNYGMDTSENGVADLFHKMYPDDFIFCNGNWKCFNGKYWENGDLILRKTLSHQFYHTIRDALESKLDNIPKENKEKIKDVQSQIEFVRSKLKKTKFKRDVVYECQEFYTNNEAKFDFKWNILAFKNLVFDLKTHQFREHKYDDYISITTGYDWEEPNSEDIEYLLNIFRMIQPVPQELECLLRSYSTGLEGRVFLYFVILNGRGQNGKTFMNNLVLECLGHNLAMTGNNSLLTEQRRTGAQPELANIHQKRCIIFEEPKKEKKLQNSIIKELTGGNGLTARQLYSGVTELMTHGTFMLACNQTPHMAEDITDADMSRILDIKFKSRFVKPELYHLVNEEKHIYKANEEFKTDEFKVKYKTSVMKILMLAHERYAEDNYCLRIPQSFQENTKTYLEKSSQVMEWFEESYEKVMDKGKYIKLGEIYEEFKEAEFYKSMSRAEKAQWLKNNFIKHFADSPFTSDDYVEKKNIILNGKRNCFSNILTGYQKRLEMVEEEKD